jgi:hypothetical protein
MSKRVLIVLDLLLYWSCLLAVLHPQADKDGEVKPFYSLPTFQYFLSKAIAYLWSPDVEYPTAKISTFDNLLASMATGLANRKTTTARSRRKLGIQHTYVWKFSA